MPVTWSKKKASCFRLTCPIQLCHNQYRASILLVSVSNESETSLVKKTTWELCSKYVFPLSTPLATKTPFRWISTSLPVKSTRNPFRLRAEIDDRFASRSGTYNTSFIRINWPLMLTFTSSMPYACNFSPLATMTVIWIFCLLINIDSFGVICLLAPEFIIEVMERSLSITVSLAI